MAKMEKAADVLKRNGAKNIEGYVLVSNFGYTFELDGKRYDARYWANSYGCAMNRWMVHSLSRNEDGTYFQMEEGTKKKLEAELNACGET